jgi:ABC-type glycerol-3-phosphate transport system permease component
MLVFIDPVQPLFSFEAEIECYWFSQKLFLVFILLFLMFLPFCFILIPLYLLFFFFSFSTPCSSHQLGLMQLNLVGRT